MSLKIALTLNWNADLGFVAVKAALKTPALQTLRAELVPACRAPASGVRTPLAPLWVMHAANSGVSGSRHEDLFQGNFIPALARRTGSMGEGSFASQPSL